MKTCPKCKEAVAKDAGRCPFCGSSTFPAKKFLLGLSIILAAGIAGATAISAFSKTTDVGTRTAAAGNYESTKKIAPPRTDNTKNHPVKIQSTPKETKATEPR